MDKRILLIMDGHGTHTHGQNINYCQENNIDVCFLPPHTSHLTQPLDVGIFNAYKAAYRRCSNHQALKKIDFNIPSVATRKRTININQALLAKMSAVNSYNIRSAFHKSGIYPLCFFNFLHNACGVLGVPPEVREQVRMHVQNSVNERSRLVASKGRVDVSDRTVVIRSSVEI
jgi:hypothetical protein